MISSSGTSIQKRISKSRGALITNLNQPTRYSLFRLRIILDIEADVAVKKAQDKARNIHILFYPASASSAP